MNNYDYMAHDGYKRMEELKPKIPVEEGVYEIQSRIDPKYGATVYPKNIHKGGAGWYFYRLSGKVALSPQEMRTEAECGAVEELQREVQTLYLKENHDE